MGCLTPLQNMLKNQKRVENNVELFSFLIFPFSLFVTCYVIILDYVYEQKGLKFRYESPNMDANSHFKSNVLSSTPKQQQKNLSLSEYFCM